MHKHFRRHCAALYDTAVGGEVASKHCNAARFAVRIVHGTDDICVTVHRVFNVFTQRFARAGHDRCVEQVEFCQLFEHGINAARLVQILHIGVTRGGKVAEIRRFFADFVCHVKIKFHAALIGDGRQVQHAVGGAAQSHVGGQGIFNSALRHNVTGTDVFPDQLHHLHSGVLRKLDSCGIYRRNGTVAAKTHAENLSQAVHGVCRIHARAGAAGGAGIFLADTKLLLVYFARLICAHRLKHARKACFLSIHPACKHRAAADENGRNINSRRRHQKSGNVLVAVGHHNKSVKAVSQRHGLGGIGNHVAGDKGIFHSPVSHGNAVADRNCGEHNGCASRHCHTQLHRLNNFVEIHVTRNNFIVGADYTDKRS